MVYNKMNFLKPFKNPIYVTKPFLPPFDQFTDGLLEIWENQWLTNRGPVLKRFESALKSNVQSDNLCLFSNGTLALQIGLQGMGISGEVITTPFTFVATTHALYWNKIRPVFCDIEPDYFTIDPDKIESLITPWTTAILAVHVFGHPCKHEQLKSIAKKYNLKLIYDSAHAFGVKINSKPIANFGDMSMFSFHATKLFHSIEGGMLVYKDSSLTQIFNYLKNFGFKNETEVVMPGTNAKMNELQSLMGFQNLDYLEDIIRKKKEISETYKYLLKDTEGINFCPELDRTIEPNFSYVPVKIDKYAFGIDRDQLYENLKKYNIFVRKYFFPLVTDFSCYKNISTSDKLLVSKDVSSNIITLPTYYDLAIDDVKKICDIIKHIKKISGRD